MGATGLFFVPPSTGQDLQASDSHARMRLAIEDMGKPHEFQLHGIEAKSGWHLGPYVVMGADPYGRSLPQWWRQGRRHHEWRSLAAWFTVYLDARGSLAKNTGVEINGLESWVLRRSSRTWQLLRSQTTPTWQGAYHPNAVDSLRKSGGLAARGGEGFVANPTSAYMVHGGMQQTALPWDDTADMLALLVSIRHRLSLVDPASIDDRSMARMGLIAGADYYPWVGAGLADLAAAYNPGAGSGRLRQSHSHWRYSTVLLHLPALKPTELLELTPPAFVY